MTYPDIRDRLLWSLAIDHKSSMNPLDLMDRLSKCNFRGIVLVETNLWRYQRKFIIANVRERSRNPNAYRPALQSMISSMRNKHRAFGPRRRYNIECSPMGPITIDIDRLSFMLYRSPPFHLDPLETTTRTIKSCLEPSLLYTTHFFGLAEHLNE